jgi:hypothetical protein
MADTATFFQVFSEFNSVANAKATATFWLTQAQNQLALNRLGANADLAVYLFMAHNLTLNAQDVQDVDDGGLPGDTLGPVASKSAGGLSVSYDSGSIEVEGAGELNATSYGQRLAALLKRASAGQLFYAAIPNRPHVFPPRGGLT